MGRPIDKIDTNNDKAKYNISPSSVIQNMPTKPDYGNAYSQGYINGYLKGKKDQMQQKTGHWIEENDGWDGIYWSCSECGESYTFIDGTPEDNNYNYCPNCGAEMRKDGDDIDS